LEIRAFDQGEPELDATLELVVVVKQVPILGISISFEKFSDIF
jgi:hypothetical protein